VKLFGVQRTGETAKLLQYFKMMKQHSIVAKTNMAAFSEYEVS
jgi:hypothetical protein